MFWSRRNANGDSNDNSNGKIGLDKILNQEMVVWGIRGGVSSKPVPLERRGVITAFTDFGFYFRDQAGGTSLFVWNFPDLVQRLGGKANDNAYAHGADGLFKVHSFQLASAGREISEPAQLQLLSIRTVNYDVWSDFSLDGRYKVH